MSYKEQRKLVQEATQFRHEQMERHDKAMKREGECTPPPAPKKPAAIPARPPHGSASAFLPSPR